MTASNPADSSKHFPLMKLPPEIRLMIYEHAVRDNIAAAESKATDFDMPTPQPYVGALALIHTTSTIRKESRGAMLVVAYRQWKSLHARYKSLFKLWSATACGTKATASRDLERADFKRYFKNKQQSYVWGALEGPGWAKAPRS